MNQKLITNGLNDFEFKVNFLKLISLSPIPINNSILITYLNDLYDVTHDKEAIIVNRYNYLKENHEKRKRFKR
jgi:hypothetical protein